MNHTPTGTTLADEADILESARNYAASPRLDAGDKDLARITTLAWDAIRMANQPPFLFLHAGRPARIEPVAGGTARIVHLSVDRLRYHLADSARWIRRVRRDDTFVEKPDRPPMDVVRNMLAAPSIPLPVLARIVGSPVFARDGDLHDQPGYSGSTLAYYAPPEGFQVPPVAKAPVPADVAKARAILLEEVLGDFPFAGDAEQAHAVALMVLPMVRDLIAGPTPIHLIEAPEAGTGKSLLANVLMIPAVGQLIGAMTEAQTEEEWRKRITSSLMTAPTFIFIDNIRNLDSAALSSATTALTWTDRVLGGSDNVNLSIRCAWVVTGNNPTLTPEVARRTVRIRLDARRDRPWERQSFRHPNIIGWMAAHRGEIVCALLTLVRAWIAAGRPAGKKTLGSFEDWAGVMGGILDTAGIPGFLCNTNDLYEVSNAEGAALKAFVEAWWDEFSVQAVGVADLFDIAMGQGTFDLGEGKDRTSKTRLGLHMNGLRDRQFGPYRIEVAGKATTGANKGAKLYRLVQVGETAGNEGNDGNVSHPTPTNVEDSITSATGGKIVPQPSPPSPTAVAMDGDAPLWEAF